MNYSEYESLLLNVEKNVCNGRLLQLRFSFNEAQLKFLEKKKAEYFHRIDHIISIGNTWDEDEIMLIFTLRINLELLKLIFGASGIEFKYDLSDFDQRLQSIGTSKLNRSKYNLAKRILKRNTTLPVDFINKIFGW